MGLVCSLLPGPEGFFCFKGGPGGLERRAGEGEKFGVNEKLSDGWGEV